MDSRWEVAIDMSLVPFAFWSFDVARAAVQIAEILLWHFKLAPGCAVIEQVAGARIKLVDKTIVCRSELQDSVSILLERFASFERPRQVRAVDNRRVHDA